mgnify:FL=1
MRRFNSSVLLFVAELAEGTTGVESEKVREGSVFVGCRLLNDIGVGYDHRPELVHLLLLGEVEISFTLKPTDFFLIGRKVPPLSILPSGVGVLDCKCSCGYQYFCEHFCCLFVVVLLFFIINLNETRPFYMVYLLDRRTIDQYIYSYKSFCKIISF